MARPLGPGTEAYSTALDLGQFAAVQALAQQNPISLPLSCGSRPRSEPIVRPTSALLAGAGSTNPARKSGPIAAMKFQRSERLNGAVHALALLQCGVCHLHAAAQRVAADRIENERKLTTTAGRGSQ